MSRAGRTGELARAFGIDFFSVLTRGSQYRVEAMMVRLAHTQNYLLPTPSKEQVMSPANPEKCDLWHVTRAWRTRELPAAHALQGAGDDGVPPAQP